MSLGPLAILLLLPLLLFAGVRSRRWGVVAVTGAAAAIAALVVPVAAIALVVAALVSLMAGALLIGTGVQGLSRPLRTMDLAELVVGSLAVRWWRRRQVRRWSDRWARRWVDVPRGR